MPTTGRPQISVAENFTPLSPNGPAIPGEAQPCIAGVFPRGPLAPTAVTSPRQFTNLFGDYTTDPGNLFPFAVQQFFLNGGSQLFVARIPNSDAVSASLQLLDVAESPSDIVTVTASSPGVWGQNIFVEVVTAGTAGRFSLNVYFNGSANTNLAETFQDLSTNPSDPRYVVNMVNSPITGSQYVVLSEDLGGPYVLGSTDLALVAPSPLTGGNDGVTAPDITTALPAQLDTLIDQALYINVPGLDDITALTTLESWAAGRGDVMFVIDGPAPNLPESTATVTSNYLAMVSGDGSLPDSTYLTVYAPWLLVQDPSSTVPGATRYLPPGGAVLGQWNATDAAFGTVQTPAGVNNSLQVIDLEARFSNTQLDTLNDNFVNAIKLIPGKGFLIFGGRTLHPGYPDRYIAVRRMIIKLEHDFKWILLFALFQPNNAVLWKQITSVLQTYLGQLLQAGQLGGDTPADSFMVICDDTTTTPAQAMAGIVNVNVAVSLLSPAEYINITLSMFQGDGTTSVTTTNAGS
jgi:hypothetical protein